MANSASGPKSTSATLNRNLAIFLILNALVLNGLMWFVSPPDPDYSENTLHHTLDVIRGESADDSWGALQTALDHLKSKPDTPLYTEVFFKRGIRFQYPPPALFALVGMQLIAPERVRTTEVYSGPEPTINAMIGWALLIAMGWATAALLEQRLRQEYGEAAFSHRSPWRVVVVFAFLLTFYPVTKAFSLGQIQVWINAAVAIALVTWNSRYKAAAGVLIGFICLIKPHYSVILLWAALRREWSFAVACVLMIGVGLAASVAVYGWQNHVDYLSVVSFLSQHGEAFYPNQSVNGLLNRLMSLRAPELYVVLDFPTGKFPPFNVWVYAGTLVSSAVILLLAIMRRTREYDPRGTLDFCTMIVAATMASPIAWEHHYGVLLPAFALLLPRAVRQRHLLVWLAVAYVLASHYIPATNLLAHTPFNVAQSYLLASALIILTLLLRRTA